MRHSLCLLAVAAISASTCAASAQSLRETCSNTAGAVLVEPRIAACSTLIGDRSLPARDRSQFYIDRAWSHGLQGKWGAAFEDYSAALKGDPANPKIHNEKGLARLRMGRFADAVTNYNAALKLDPRLPYSLFGRGIARMRLGEGAPAQADIASARAIMPGIDAVFLRIGIVP